MPWYLDTEQLWEDYYAAVTDAITADSDEICHVLPTIVSTDDSSRAEWISENGRKFVLVGSMISADDAKEWSSVDSLLSVNSILWVTLPYDMEDHMRSSFICADSLECRMRLLQLLGLPPNCNYDRMVFFYVEGDYLLRPSPDPEIDDQEASLDFSADVSEHYRKWFAENMVFSYESDTPYPWTRLGYTYDWNGAAESVVGPGEFIVQPGAQVRVKSQVSVWAWYREVIK